MTKLLSPETKFKTCLCVKNTESLFVTIAKLLMQIHSINDSAPWHTMHCARHLQIKPTGILTSSRADGQLPQHLLARVAALQMAELWSISSAQQKGLPQGSHMHMPASRMSVGGDRIPR